MELNEKILIRLRLAAALRILLARNKNRVLGNKAKGVEDVSAVDSIRQLEAASRLSYTIVQGVFAADRDIQFTSLLSIIEEGFGITLTEFSKIYDSLTDEDIKKTKKEIAASKTQKATSKKK